MKIAFALIAVLLVGGLVYLSVAPLPAPTQSVEKTVPDDQLGK